MAEHFEDDAADVAAESADGLIMPLAFGSFSLVVAQRLGDPFAMVIDGSHHRCLGANIDTTDAAALLEMPVRPENMRYHPQGSG